MKFKAKHLPLWCAFCALLIPLLTNAAELKIMSAGAVEPGVEIAIHQFEKSTGNKVTIQFGTGPQLRERLASNQVFDILIAPNALINEQLKQGRLQTGISTYIGKVGAGITVRAEVPKPDIQNVDDLKKYLLAADRIIYNKASTGIYLDKLFTQLGVMDAIQSKVIRYDNGESVLMHIIRGSGNEIGFGAITEIKLFEPKGLQFVGPLPSNVQNYTSYDAGIVATSINVEIAKNFLMQMQDSRLNGQLQRVGIE
ncbi:substrate-binding domain-containing protein [Polynucleobacter sinensis]|uniref:substrate-binding domain-containing protein n=1 Tax=Polynucleobacter sinensis TaxID=1743157 RepID=UPI00078351D0|nr:substrate-binding domain-containing protein [Polynucleobacter sinensis]